MVEGLKRRIGSRETNGDNANISLSKDHNIVDGWMNWIREKYLIWNNGACRVIDTHLLRESIWKNKVLGLRPKSSLNSYPPSSISPFSTAITTLIKSIECKSFQGF